MVPEMSDKPQGELAWSALARGKVLGIDTILNHRELVAWEAICRVLRGDVATWRNESVYLTQRKQEVGITHRRRQRQMPRQHLSTVEAGETALFADVAVIFQESI